MSVKNIVIQSGDSGMRLDKYMKKNYPVIPRSLLEKWCRKGNIRVNSKRVKAAHVLEESDMLRLPPLPIEGDRIHKPKVDVLSQGDMDLVSSLIQEKTKDYLVINKPAGLAVQGGTNTTKSLDKLLKVYFADEDCEPRLVHRLDKDTSGIMLMALNYKMAQYLTNAFKEKAVQKTYIALAVGYPDPDEGTIRLALDKDFEGDHEKMVVAQHGKKAITHLKVLDHALDKISVLRLIPETGRTHQLRVHCDAIGHPILGDGKYGGQDAHPFDQREKMHLHAREITIPLPGNSTHKTYKAGFPKHFKDTFSKFGFEESEF